MDDAAAQAALASKKRRPGKALILVVTLISLLPAGWVFWGRWFGDTLDWSRNRDAFTIFAGVCLAALILLIYWMHRPPSVVETGCPAQAEDRQARTVSVRQARLAYALLGLCAVALVAEAAGCLAQRRLPGVELPLILAVGWAGLALRSWPAGRIARSMARRLIWLGPALLFTAALLAFFYFVHSARVTPWLALVPPVLGGALLWAVRAKIPAGVWLFWIGLIAGLSYLDHWLYTAIGDEYSFWMLAREYAELPLALTGQRLFQCCAVYGAHPFFSTAIQVGWMKLFGTFNFGWRSLNPFLCALAAPLFLSFFSTFLPRRAALSAAFFLAGSSYLLSFSKIGYNNLQAYFALGLVLACLGWAIRARSSLTWASLGLACGLCFYVYPAALYALPLPVVFLLVFCPPIRTKAPTGLPGSQKSWADSTFTQEAIRWVAFLGGLTLLALPMLVQPRFWGILAPGTVYYTPALVQSWGALGAHLLSNLRYAFFSGWIIPQETHYVVSAYQDPLSAGLAWLGLAVVVNGLRRSRFLVAWVICFLVMLVLAGASHDRTFPPATRMFMLLPWFASFAALGLDWLLARFQAGRRVWAGALALILLLNLAGAAWLTGIRNTAVQSTEALFMRLVQTLGRADPATPRTYLFLSGPRWGIDGFRIFQRIYPHWLTGDALIDTDLTGPLPSGTLALAARNNTFVIETAFLDPGLTQDIQAAMQALGKRCCFQRTLDGQARFAVWYTPDAASQADPCSAPLNVSARLPGLGLLFLLAVGLDVLLLRWLRRRRSRPRASP